MERALILHQDGPLDHTPFIRQTGAPSTHEEDSGSPPFSLKLDDCITWQIERALYLAHGKISGPGGAAQMLGINAGTLRNKMKKLGIIYCRK